MIKKNKNGKFSKINDFSDIENNEYVLKWLDGIKSKSERVSIMAKFCSFLGKNPTELAQEHQNDLKLDVLKRSNIAKKQLNNFFGYLTNTDNKKWKNSLNNKIISNPVAWNSARQYVFSKLLSFYSRLEISVKYNINEKPIVASKNIREKTWRTKINGERKIIKHFNKKECLKKIRDSFNSLRDKAIFIGKLNSALDDVDMFNLKIKDFKNGYLPEYNICYLQGNRQKDGVLYQTFFGNEGCNMLNLYLNDRLDKINKKGTKKITEIPKTEYLFIANNKKMIGRYFNEKMKEITDKLELSNITPKSLRRWFNTHLEKNSVKTSIIRRLMGHKGDIGDEHYNQMFEQAKEGEYEELAHYFNENIDALVSLGNGNRKKTEVDNKIKKLEIDNEALKDKLINMKSEYDKKLSDMEDFIKQLDQKISKGIIGGQISQFQEFFKAMNKEVDITEITKFLSKSGFTKEKIIINPDLGEGKSKNMKKDK